MLLLGMMAFDCYVAICNPLRYPVIMSKVVYIILFGVDLLASARGLIHKASSNLNMVGINILYEISLSKRMKITLYLLILIGKHVLIIASIFDSRLHTLMYFFLRNLSFLDVCYTSSSVPSTLVSLISKKRNISFSGCVVQMFLGFAMGSTECFFLGMMAFDCYVAICNPLRYPVIMSKVVYVLMASVSWLSGRINSIVQTSLAMRLPFCDILEIQKTVEDYKEENIVTTVATSYR
eukprot:bmy_12608T0